MRTCGRCKQVPRLDDHLTIAQYSEPAPDGSFVAVAAPTITVAVCRHCRAELEGFAGAAEPMYPHGREYEFPVCGICRLALRDDDGGTKNNFVRLAPAEVAGTEITPGLYQACRDCVEHFRPAIYERLQVERLDPARGIPELPAFKDFRGDWLI